MGQAKQRGTYEERVAASKKPAKPKPEPQRPTRPGMSAMFAMARAGVTLDDVERTLDGRSLKLTRRPGDAK